MIDENHTNLKEIVPNFLTIKDKDDFVWDFINSNLIRCFDEFNVRIILKTNLLRNW